MKLTIDVVLDSLDRAGQRATYGAVAGVLGLSPRSVMSGCPKDTRHSWVVRKSTGMPTGYAEGEYHAQLTSRPEVIDSPSRLAQWLE